MRAVPSLVTPPTLGLVGVLLIVWRDESWWARLSLATGYGAAVLLVATLLVTPVYRAAVHRPPPVHLPLRRSLGVHAGVLALTHVAVSFPVHLGGDVVRFFFTNELTPLVTRFGVANWVGAVATAGLVVLLVTSTDRALRRLGATRWRRLHRLVHPVALLVLVHAVTYQNLRGASPVLIAVVLVTAAALVAGRRLRTTSW
jgi:sulfoxide reductase heme-binding subunit YedZ